MHEMVIPELEGRLAVDVPTAGRLLGISRNSAYEAARIGALPSVRLRGRVIVPVAALMELLANNDGPATKKQGQA